MSKITKILLIDDDRDDGDLFREALQEVAPAVGFEYFADGKLAIAELSKPATATPELIFLDINMPTINGWDCLAVLKQIDRLHTIPIIMYTTASGSNEKAAAKRLGAADLITKPDSYEQLKSVITTVLGMPA